MLINHVMFVLLSLCCYSVVIIYKVVIFEVIAFAMIGFVNILQKIRNYQAIDGTLIIIIIQVFDKTKNAHTLKINEKATRHHSYKTSQSKTTNLFWSTSLFN